LSCAGVTPGCIKDLFKKVNRFELSFNLLPEVFSVKEYNSLPDSFETQSVNKLFPFKFSMSQLNIYDSFYH
jgi:hypothetical protein